MKKILFLFTLSFSLNSFSQTDYYYKGTAGTGNITNALNWGPNLDGTGLPPTDFTDGDADLINDNYHIANTAAVSLDANWALGGTAIVDDGVNFTIGGALQIDQGGLGGSLDIGASSAATGTITITSSVLNAAKLAFTLAGGTVIHNTTTQIAVVAYYNLIVASNAQLGAITDVNNNLTINAGVILSTGAGKLTVFGDINCIGVINGSTSAQLILNGTASSSLKFGLTKSLKNLTINPSVSSTFTLGTNLLCSNNTSSIFSINTCTLDITGVSLAVNSLSVTIGAAAVLSTSSTSTLSIGTVAGTAFTGTLTFAQANANLSKLNFNKPTRTLTLGSNLTISDATTLTAGTLDISGRLLTLNGIITNGGGLITGSATTSITIGGAGAISGTLNGLTALSDLTLNRAGQTLILGSNLTMSGATALTAGTLDVTGKLLTLNGAITLTSCSLTASATSSLSIGGAGAISGTLTGLTALSDLTLNRAAQTLILGSNLTMSGAASLTAGTLDISGRLLTLNGALTNGGGLITSSASTSLTIGGAGAIAGSILLSPSIYDLTLNRTGQTLTIGSALNIINSITPTLGTIASGGFATLIANATRSARIGIVGGSISGNVTVQTYAASSGVTGWTNLASSGISGLTVANWDGQFPITCNGCTTSTTSAGGAFASMQGGNEAGTGGTEYVTVSNTTALTPATGFWVYLGTGLSTTTPITILETGSAVQGTVPVPLTKTPAGQNGYNLIANPYTSPISWPATAASNGMIDGSAYLYSPVGGQITLNGSGVSTPGGYNTGGVIAMGQGFYVNATFAGTFNFLESHKSAANTSANPLLKTNETNSISEFRLGITDPYGYYDETVIIADNSATSNFDNMLDAYKMFQTPGYSGTSAVYSQYTTINSLSNNKDYAINSLPLSSTQNLVIPIRAKAMVSGTYTISPLQIQNLPTTSCVTLKDKLLNINHDLRTGSYVFNLSDTTSTPRFELTICADQSVTSIKPLYANNNNVLIGQDGTAGVFVKTTFDNSTKSVISAYNVMGQKIITDKEIEGSENLVYLDFKDLHNQIIIIKVSNEKGQTTKKVFLN